MRLPHFSRFITILLVLFLSMGCSQKFNDINETLELAMFGNEDAVLSQDDITQLPYASIYARIENGPLAFMVLAFAEPGEIDSTGTTPIQLKWLSADGGMLVTEHGRLVKTLNLPQGNLVSSNSNTADPLKLGLHLPATPKAWIRQIDWQPDYHFGYQLQSKFQYRDSEIIMINEEPKEALHFTEHVSVPSIQLEFDNEFWIHPITGKVLKSRQKIAPNQPFVEITLLKPFS